MTQLPKETQKNGDRQTNQKAQMNNVKQRDQRVRDSRRRQVGTKVQARDYRGHYSNALRLCLRLRRITRRELKPESRNSVNAKNPRHPGAGMILRGQRSRRHGQHVRGLRSQS